MENQTNLLLVEDDAMLRSIIAECLRSRGYAVMAVSNGPDAHTEFVSRPHGFYQVVVSDYHMPGMYGDKLRDRIYNSCDSNGYERPVFVIMSGAWGGGASDSGFLAKPFEPAVLHGVIQKLLMARRAA